MSDSGFNSCVVLGRLDDAPEELKTKAGKLFLKAPIRVAMHRKNENNESEYKFCIVIATLYGPSVELFLKYVRKNDYVHLSGRLDSNEWITSAGKKRRSLAFVVEHIGFLPNKRE